MSDIADNQTLSAADRWLTEREALEEEVRLLRGSEERERSCKIEMVKAWRECKAELATLTARAEAQAVERARWLKQLAHIRDALIARDTSEAYHQLYALADPTFTIPEAIEKLVGPPDFDRIELLSKPAPPSPTPSAFNDVGGGGEKCETCGGDGYVRNSREEANVVGEDWSDCPDCRPPASPTSPSRCWCDPSGNQGVNLRCPTHGTEGPDVAATSHNQESVP